VTVELDPHDSNAAVIRRDVGGLKRRCVRPVRRVRRIREAVRFTRLEFVERLDVSGFVDRLEDLPKSVATLHPSADGKSCEVTLPGVGGRILIERQSLTVRGRAGGTGGLLDLLLAFLSAVGPIGDAPPSPRPGIDSASRSRTIAPIARSPSHVEVPMKRLFRSAVAALFLSVPGFAQDKPKGPPRIAITTRRS